MAKKKLKTLSITIVAFILSIVSIFTEFVPILGSLVALTAITLSILSLNKIKNENLGGKGLTIWALALGCITLLVSIFMLFAVLADTSDEENALIEELSKILANQNELREIINTYIRKEDTESAIAYIEEFRTGIGVYSQKVDEYIYFVGNTDDERQLDNIEVYRENIIELKNAMEIFEESLVRQRGSNKLQTINDKIDDINALSTEIRANIRDNDFKQARKNLDKYVSYKKEIEQAVEGLEASVESVNYDENVQKTIAQFDDIISDIIKISKGFELEISAAELDQKVSQHEKFADQINYYIRSERYSEAFYLLGRFESMTRDIEVLLNSLESLAYGDISYRPFIEGKRTYVRDTKNWAWRTKNILNRALAS